MWSFHGFEFASTNVSSHFKLLYFKGFEVRKKSLKRHFHEKITSRDGSKHGPCLMNNITNVNYFSSVIKTSYALSRLCFFLSPFNAADLPP